MASKHIPSPAPASIEFLNEGKQIVIDWKDGGRTAITAFDLRRLCPCASCVHEMTGTRILRREDVDSTVTATSCRAVGRYGQQIQWSDGHNTGIYTHRMLRVVEPITESG
jgi:DUF971 family protein